MNFAAGNECDVVQKNDAATLCQSCSVQACGFREFTATRDAVKFKTLERGQALECNDGACLRFWIITKGHAATCKWFRDGRRQILSIERSGDTVCGPASAQESEQKLEALTDCQICEIDLSPWAAELLRDPRFLAMTVRLMHARLEKSMAHSAALGRLDSNERITYFLAEMAIHDGRSDRLVTLPMSREDIADYLGLNTDSVSRVLSRIRKSGLFRFVSATEYTVPDMQAVARRLPVGLPVFPASIHLAGDHA